MTATDRLRRLPGLVRGIDMAALIQRFRPRADPPVDGDGLLDIGSEHFRKSAAFFEDGRLHVVKDESAAVFDELYRLRRTFRLPKVTSRHAATPVNIAILHGKPATAGRRTDVGDLEPGARRFLAVLDEVAELGASDVKFYGRGDHANLRVKIGAGEHTHGDPWPLRDAAQAIAYLYDERALGDGSASQLSAAFQPFAISAGGHVPLPDGVVSLRGQKGFVGDNHDMLALRILYSRENRDAGQLEALGFDDDILEVLAEERRSDNGLVVIGGSTGDGKSTTLVRLLERLYQERDGQVSICTVEDPIEYPLPGEGIGQFPVRASARGEARSQEYSETLRHFVRVNPDIGMVSEIRSAEDATRIIDFVTSGHKLFTTIHSPGANAAIFRIISLGASARDLAGPGVVSLAMRQMLVPVLCEACKWPATADQRDHVARWTGISGARPMVRNRGGCEVCLKGREGDLGVEAWGGLSRSKAVAEYVRADNTWRRFVENVDHHGADAYWLKPRAEGGMGGRTLEDRIAALVATGEVDYADITHDRAYASRDPISRLRGMQ